MNSDSGVYSITNSISGNRYVGSSSNMLRRQRRHLHELRHGKHRNAHLQAAFDKYGESSMVFSVLEKTADCIGREQHYIDTLKPEYNILPNAGKTTGYHHSASTKEKLSDILKIVAPRGEAHYNFGKHPSSESREKMRIAKLGRSTFRMRPVERVSENGDITHYPAIKAVKLDGFDPGAVGKCCRGQILSYRGYSWQYATGTLE